MKTELITDTKIAEYDEDILKALKAAGRKLGGSSKPYIVGIRNEHGTIYRKADMGGLQQVIYLAERLEDLGFEDELLENDRPPKGWDSIFSREK
ncbi:MAG: hypothetical protein EKK45_19245 [Curvibacter sp.]|nr:MAG: hypothetical protein EKK45_19245 [Curvibacter sp.]